MSGNVQFRMRIVHVHEKTLKMSWASLQFDFDRCHFSSGPHTRTHAHGCAPAYAETSWNWCTIKSHIIKSTIKYAITITSKPIDMWDWRMVDSHRRRVIRYGANRTVNVCYVCSPIADNILRNERLRMKRNLYARQTLHWLMWIITLPTKSVW